MSQNLLSLLINLLAAAVGGAAVWLWRKFVTGRRRRQRLRTLKRAATEGEVAVCVRVGGMGDPVPDVLKYLREKQPAIRQLIVYSVNAEQADHRLDEPEVSNRIVKDLCDVIRAYGEGEVSRVHFFPAGMLAYPLVFGAMFNWCTLVVYYKSKDSYVPLYEIDRDWIYKGQDEFKSFREWEVLSVSAAAAPSAPPPAQLREPAPALRHAPAGAVKAGTPKLKGR